MPPLKLLAFDIGATKTNAALFSDRPGASSARTPHPFSWSCLNVDMAGPEELIAEGLRSAGTPVDMIVLAMAGPVSQNQAQLTNRAWFFDKQQIKKRFGVAELFMINDLEAIALGIPHLQPDQIRSIQNVPPAAQSPIAVIAPGTGLGESYLAWSRDRYIAHPSEGGHGDFAPIDDLQIELLKFLMRQYGHVSYERICSGFGIYNIYNFLKMQVGMKEPAWLAEKINREQDPAKSIVTAANDEARPCDISRRAISIFVAVLGSEAGNLALRTLSRGGVYIGGGIAPHIVPYFTTGQFMTAFTHKGRMKQLLETIPVNIILDTKIPLLGAAYYGFNHG